MYASGKKLVNCKEMILAFLKERGFIKGSVEAIGLMIDIYYEITYTESYSKVAKEKFIKALYSLQNSNVLCNFLKEDCAKVFISLITDFLYIVQESDSHYIGNDEFAQLDLHELQSILIEIRYHQLSYMG